MKISMIILALLMTLNAMTQNLSDKKTVRFLALGDSYTIGESVPEQERWPVQLEHALRANKINCEDPLIIATTGWRTDDLKRAIEQRKPAHNYDIVSLLIGVNNQYQGKSAASYEPEFEELLNIAIRHAGGEKSRVFVVSIPDYGYTPFGKEKQAAITKDIDAFNAVNKKISEKLGVDYINITDISRRGFQQPELVASDGLHPSGKMYHEWVTLILKRFVR
jgi:lysophospholipase L1-like esterase